MSIQKSLRELLVAHGWSQRKLADESGIGQTNISNWLAGRSEPGWDGVCKIADAFGVPVDDLRQKSGKAKRKERQQIIVRVLVGPVGGPYSERSTTPIAIIEHGDY